MPDVPPTAGRGLSRRSVIFAAGAVTIAGAGGLALWLARDRPFVLGTTRPSAVDTGVRPGTVLTRVDGDLVLAAGRRYQDLDIHGFVTGAPGAVLTNSRVRGRGTGYIKPGLVNGDETSAGLTIDRCTLRPAVPQYFLNGFDGSHATVTRCDISGVVDGVHVTGDDVAVLGCYIHDLAFFDGSTGSDHADDAVHPGWTHNDGVQILAGRDVRVVGNTVDVFFSPVDGTPGTAVAAGYPDRNYGTGVIITPVRSAVTGYRVVDNWLDGGDRLVQLVATGRGFDTGNDGEVAGNRCGAAQHPLAGGRLVQMRAAAGFGSVAGSTTNVFDTTASVPRQLRGAPLIPDSADALNFSFQP